MGTHKNLSFFLDNLNYQIDCLLEIVHDAINANTLYISLVNNEQSEIYRVLNREKVLHYKGEKADIDDVF